LTFRIISIYGYSFASFIPATFLYIIPLNGFKWLILLVAGGISLFFLAKELLQIIRTNLGKFSVFINLESVKTAALVT